MAHDGRMCRSSESPLERILAGLRDLPAWVAEQPAGQLGEVIITSREIIDRTEAVGAEATRRFEKAGGYRSDGFLGMVPWLRVNGKLSGAAAAERVDTARQLKELPAPKRPWPAARSATSTRWRWPAPPSTSAPLRCAKPKPPY